MRGSTAFLVGGVLFLVGGLVSVVALVLPGEPGQPAAGGTRSRESAAGDGELLRSPEPAARAAVAGSGDPRGEVSAVEHAAGLGPGPGAAELAAGGPVTLEAYRRSVARTAYRVGQLERSDPELAAELAEAQAVLDAAVARDYELVKRCPVEVEGETP